VYPDTTLERWAKPFVGNSSLAAYNPPPPVGSVQIQGKKGASAVSSILSSHYTQDDDGGRESEEEDEEEEDIDGEPM